MAKVSIDGIKINKPPRSGTCYAMLTIPEGLPVPMVGDSIVIMKGDRARVIKIERRNFHYLKECLYLQLFFTKAE
jgi:hypothetical protein